MSKRYAFLFGETLALTFPQEIRTDVHRILYALWHERMQSLDRLCVLTNLPADRVFKAVNELVAAGRVRAEAFDAWQKEHDIEPGSQPSDKLQSAGEIQNVLSSNVSLA